MAQYNITIDSEILHYLFLKGVKDEGMTKLLESVLNQVLQAQAAEQIKAEPYERTEEREDYRNGYYKRRLETRVGNIVLQIPRFRYGKFTTDLFQRYQRSVKFKSNKQAVIQEFCNKGRNRHNKGYRTAHSHGCGKLRGNPQKRANS